MVVLDIMMPNTDGLRALTALRAAGDDIPVIFVTARGTVADRIVGLSLGADDYLTKPFDPRELLARIQTVLRRRGPVDHQRARSTQAYRFGHFELDFATRTLSRDNQRLRAARQRIRAAEDLRQQSVQGASRACSSTISCTETTSPFATAASTCRSGGCAASSKTTRPSPCYVQTVRGKGYVFVPDADGTPFSIESAADS